MKTDHQNDAITSGEITDLERSQIEFNRLVAQCESRINDYLGLSEAMKFGKEHPLPTRESFFSDPLWKQKIEDDCEKFLDDRIPKTACKCGCAVRLHKHQVSIVIESVCGDTIRKVGDSR